MSNKIKKTVYQEVKDGDIDFFDRLSQEQWDKLEKLKKIQLLEIIGLLNEKMIESLENWDGG